MFVCKCFLTRPGVSNLFDRRATCTNFNYSGPDRDAKGIERREWGGDVLLPSRLGGLWERCKLPQRGPGQKMSFGVF